MPVDCIRSSPFDRTGRIAGCFAASPESLFRNVLHPGKEWIGIRRGRVGIPWPLPRVLAPRAPIRILRIRRSHVEPRAQIPRRGRAAARPQQLARDRVHRHTALAALNGQAAHRVHHFHAFKLAVDCTTGTKYSTERRLPQNRGIFSGFPK